MSGGSDYRGKGVTCSHASLPEGGVELKKVILGRSHHRGSTGVQVHSLKRTPESYRTHKVELRSPRRTSGLAAGGV